MLTSSSLLATVIIIIMGVAFTWITHTQLPVTWLQPHGEHPTLPSITVIIIVIKGDVEKLYDEKSFPPPSPPARTDAINIPSEPASFIRAYCPKRGRKVSIFDLI